MKIVMLGHSGAGKTTYLALMYHAMQTGVGGFTVTAGKGKRHGELVGAAQEILRGVYPDATHQRTSYPMKLLHDREVVLPFRWADYRGGALVDRSTAADVAALHKDLLKADGIVILVDAVRLVDDPRGSRDVRRIVTHVQRAVANREEVPTPIVIGLTKCDLLDVRRMSVRSALESPFTEIVDAVRATKHLHGAIVHLSCGPTPRNVVVPALWMLRWAVEGLSARTKAEAKAAEWEARYHAGRNNPLRWLEAKLDGDRTPGQKARAAWDVAEERLAELGELVEHVKHLDDQLDDVESF